MCLRFPTYDPEEEKAKIPEKAKDGGKTGGKTKEQPKSGDAGKQAEAGHQAADGAVKEAPPVAVRFYHCACWMFPEDEEAVESDVIIYYQGTQKNLLEIHTYHHTLMF